MFGWLKRKETPRHVRAVGLSSTGNVRQENQDGFVLDDAAAAYCVADGMGGGAEGKRASTIVCELFQDAIRQDAANLTARLEHVRTGIAKANEAIVAFAKMRGFAQMGSTVAALMFDAELARAAILHVGDSRVYCVRAGAARALTDDHTIGFELSKKAGAAGETYADRTNPLAHILTRVVGGGAIMKADACEVDVEAGDRFVICSDGVHDVLDAAALGRIVGGVELEAAKAALAQAVDEAGAPDNYSFILIDVRED